MKLDELLKEGYLITVQCGKSVDGERKTFLEKFYTLEFCSTIIL